MLTESIEQAGRRASLPVRRWVRTCRRIGAAATLAMWLAASCAAVAAELTVPPAAGTPLPVGPAPGAAAVPPDSWEPPPSRRHLIVRLPVVSESTRGDVAVVPNVEQVDFAPASTAFDGGSPDGFPQLSPAAEGPFPPSVGGSGGGDAPLPPWPIVAGDAAPAVEPVFGAELERLQEPRPHRFGPLGLLWRMAHRTSDVGLGQERLDYAPFEIDAARPLNHFRFRTDVVTGYPWPDRSEYLWAKPGKGPPADTGVGYQDLRFMQEIGGDKFSVATELPIRLLDPENNGNTTGMGDMNLTTKTVLLDGRAWQITQILRTYFPTGAFHKGLGNGHFSMEPGLLARLKCTPKTYLHSELKYWFPIAGDPVHSGQVLRYGLGYSHVLFETDTWALLHTGEFLGFWFLDGQKVVDVATKQAVDIDGEGAFQIYPGLRLLVDTGGDLRFLDFGIAATFSTGRNSIYDSMLRFDFRFAF